MAKLKKVLQYAPERVITCAKEKLKQLNLFESGSLTGFAPIAYGNNFGLRPKHDYPGLMQRMEADAESNNNVHDPELRHEVAALLRYQAYLEKITKEGLEPDPKTIIEPELFSFAKYWPELIEFSENLIVEYTTKKSHHDDMTYVDYSAKMYLVAGAVGLLSRNSPNYLNLVSNVY